MKFCINAKIFEQFPGFICGLVSVKDVNNSTCSETIHNLLRTEETHIIKTHQINTLKDEPRICTWREAYKKFGVKKNKYTASVESLYRIVLDGIHIKHINPLVCIYNYVSLKYMLPLGGEDRDLIQGDIELTIAGINEPPVVLIGDKEAKSPKPGEVIYKDAHSAICRRWNSREANRTKLTLTTKNAIIVIDALPPATTEEVKKAGEELLMLIYTYCKGITTFHVLDKNTAVVHL